MIYIVHAPGTTFQIRADSFSDAIEKTKRILCGHFYGRYIRVTRV